MIPNHEDSQLYMVFETILLLNDNIKQTTFWLTVLLYDREIHEQSNLLPNFDSFFDFHPMFGRWDLLCTDIR